MEINEGVTVVRHHQPRVITITTKIKMDWGGIGSHPEHWFRVQSEFRTQSIVIVLCFLSTLHQCFASLQQTDNWTVVLRGAEVQPRV